MPGNNETSIDLSQSKDGKNLEVSITGDQQPKRIDIPKTMFIFDLVPSGGIETDLRITEDLKSDEKLVFIESKSTPNEELPKQKGTLTKNIDNKDIYTITNLFATYPEIRYRDLNKLKTAIEENKKAEEPNPTMDAISKFVIIQHLNTREEYINKKLEKLAKDHAIEVLYAIIKVKGDPTTIQKIPEDIRKYLMTLKESFSSNAGSKEGFTAELKKKMAEQYNTMQ
eukprot:GHVP01069584.1.p1 GENE.GHVP01069584.1~~GHVP01069584.1.p1  ORF type:complete len:226 (+),score=45.00 GHVP01069584.1:1776-2453(+)